MGSSRSFTRLSLFLFVSVLLGSTFPLDGALGASEPEAAKGPFVVELRGDRLTVRVKEIPLRMVLEAIGRHSGVEVAFAGPLEEKITASFDELPLDEGVKRFLGGRSYVFLYAAAGAGQPPSVVLSKVSVLGEGRPAGHGPEQGPPKPGRPGASAQPDPAKPAEAMEPLAAGDEAGMMRNLLEVVHQEGDGPARAAALSGLEELETVPVAPLSAIALHDRDPVIRRGALELLGRRAAADPQVREVVEAAATADSDQDVRESAIALLEVLVQGGREG